MSDEPWPALPYEAWKDTYATLHMWTQVVGKVALAQAPPVNHSWAIALQITSRGLSTRMLSHGRRSFAIEFDFIDHQRNAYSHEVISHGFWPGGGPFVEPAFYAYAVPEPRGLKEAPVQPSEAFYHRELGEFILPYEAVRSAADPDQAIRLFVDSTYEQAANLAGWDRAALDRPPIAI